MILPLYQTTSVLINVILSYLPAVPVRFAASDLGQRTKSSAYLKGL